MREIKFRAWDKIIEVMVNAYVINQTGNSSGEKVYECQGYYGQNIQVKFRYCDAEWMQYTGLKDKNGKEIYEGDVFKWSVFKGEVIFKEGCFVFDTKDNYSMTMRDHTSNEFEVIGNIYENPTLLK